MAKYNEMSKTELSKTIKKYSKELEQIKQLKSRNVENLNKQAKLGQQIYEATQWLEGIKEKENKKMAKYYNEKGEQFKLVKGTISEVKDYYGRTQVYLAYDEEDKRWHCSLAQGFMEEDGPHYNTRISWGTEVSKKGLAELCGYFYDEAGDVIL